MSGKFVILSHLLVNFIFIEVLFPKSLLRQVSLHGTFLPCWHTAPTASSTISLQVTRLFSQLNAPCSRKPMTAMSPALASQTERLNGRVKMLATKDNGGCRNRNADLQTKKQSPIATLPKIIFDQYLVDQWICVQIFSSRSVRLALLSCATY
jgi:hypothetical protein